MKIMIFALLLGLTALTTYLLGVQSERAKTNAWFAKVLAPSLTKVTSNYDYYYEINIQDRSVDVKRVYWYSLGE